MDNQNTDDHTTRHGRIMGAILTTKEEFEEMYRKQEERNLKKLPPLSIETLADIIKNGIYYDPAWKHYHAGIEVICDNCHKINIETCIGLDEYDLCIPCSEQIK